MLTGQSHGNGVSRASSIAASAPALDQYAQQALLAAIVECSDDAVVSKTLDGRILSWNGGASRIFGYTADEAIGQPITLIIPPDLHDEEREILDRLRRGERVEHFDTIRVTKDGRRISVSLTISPIRDAHGRVVAASKVARDISERKRIETQLRETEEALRDANRRKDEFLAVLAHELRNSLAPIRYALALNERCESRSDQSRHPRQMIERQLDIMSRLLDDLLDVSRLNNGKLKLQKARTDLRNVINTAVDTARPFIEAQHHILSLDLPMQTVHLEADAVRLAQVFSNLLINAAKYTDANGNIDLRAHYDGAVVVVTVADNGIGIPHDALPHVFAMFSQASATLMRAQGGLGIGLALVHAIVTLHGGTIEARSEGPGSGSEFIVRLPARVMPGTCSELSKRGAGP
jgi:PAS domain S-box-containing protein